MVNFGNTDGINSVLQLFLHAPPVRDFFLSDNHTPLVWVVIIVPSRIALFVVESQKTVFLSVTFVFFVA